MSVDGSTGCAGLGMAAAGTGGGGARGGSGDSGGVVQPGDVRSSLLPTGELMSYGSSEASDRAGTPEMQKRMAVVGPVANILFGVVLGRLCWRFRRRSTV